MRAILPLFLFLGSCADRPPETVRISAEELHRAFAIDEVSAQARLDGKAIIVDGSLAAVEGAGSPKPTVFLNTDDSTAPAFLATGPAPLWLRSAEGRRIRMRCERAEHVGEMPYLYGCALL